MAQNEIILKEKAEKIIEDVKAKLNVVGRFTEVDDIILEVLVEHV